MGDLLVTIGGHARFFYPCYERTSLIVITNLL